MSGLLYTVKITRARDGSHVNGDYLAADGFHTHPDIARAKVFRSRIAAELDAESRNAAQGRKVWGVVSF